MIYALRYKKIFLFLAILVLAGFILWTLADAALAGPTPTPVKSSPAGKGAAYAGAAAKVGEVFTGIVNIYGILYAANVLLGYLVTILAKFLDLMFFFNVAAVPITMPAVVFGWTILRDIAHSIFILIVLWVAFTIIFNQEQWGGKKLLVRVIIIALTINFSLALASGVFSIANTLATPFANKIGGGQLGEAIVGATMLQSVSKEVAQQDLDAIVKQTKIQTSQIEEKTKMASAASIVPYYLGIKSAEAIEAWQVAGACSILTLIPAGVTTIAGGACLAGVVGYSIIEGLIAGKGASGIVGSALQTISGLILSIFLLLVGVFTLVTASIVLMSRVVAMSFLAVLAPAAFLCFMLPGKIGQKYWNMWVESLVKWAFFAPAFYFLMYISLMILDQANEKLVSKTLFDLDRIFVLLMFFGFLIGATLLARKMGITVADGFVNWGQKLGWGALGFAGAAAGSFATRWGGAAAQKIESSKTYERAAPYVPFSGVIRKGMQKAAAAERGAVEAAGKHLNQQTSRELQSQYFDSSTTATQRAEILKILTKRRDMKAQPGVDTARWNAEIPRGIAHLKRIGDYDSIMEILKARPDLATPDLIPETATAAAPQFEAIKTAVKKAEDRVKFAKEVYRNQDGSIKKDVIRAMWNTTNTGELQRIGRENTDFMAAMQEYVDNAQDFANLKMELSINSPVLLGQLQDYFSAHLARRDESGLGLGWKAPAHGDKWGVGPKETHEAERQETRYYEAVERRVERWKEMEDRLTQLRQHAAGLRAAGNVKEAEKVEREADRLANVDIPLARERLQ